MRNNPPKTNRSWQKHIIQCVCTIFLLAFIQNANGEGLDGIIITDTTPATSSTASDPQLLSAYPTRLPIRGVVRIAGKHLGSDPNRYGINLRGNGSITIITVGRDSISAWTDTGFRLRLPSSLTKAGHYRLGVYDKTRGAYLTPFGLDVTMPAPVLSRYSPTTPCPGDSVTLYGRNFTDISGLFTIVVETKAPTAGSSFHGLGGNWPIEAWGDNRIQFRLRQDHAYIKPGYAYRVSLNERIRGGVRMLVRGPESHLCMAAPTQSPHLATQNNNPFRVDLSPLRPARIGQRTAFAGNLIKQSPIERGEQFMWQVIKVPTRTATHAQSIVAGTGIGGWLKLRGKRTPFIAPFIPHYSGFYRLEFRDTRNRRVYISPALQVMPTATSTQHTTKKVSPARTRRRNGPRLERKF